MTKAFKIQGNSVDQKFKYLETIIPRIYRKMNSNKTMVIPPSVIHHYEKNPNELLFKCILFKGVLKKISFSIGSVKLDNKDVALNINCSVNGDNKSQNITIKTKKLSHTVELNLVTADGDVLIITNNDGSLINDAALSILFISAFTDKQMALIEDSDERI